MLHPLTRMACPQVSLRAATCCCTALAAYRHHMRAGSPAAAGGESRPETEFGEGEVIQEGVSSGMCNLQARRCNAAAGAEQAKKQAQQQRRTGGAQARAVGVVREPGGEGRHL